MKQWVRTVEYTFVIGCIILLVIFTSTPGKSSESHTTYSVSAISIPSVLTFAGEPVPLEYFDVRESLDREIQVNTYFHSQTILVIKRAARFFPEIERILQQENVPDDFKYLAVIESNLQNVVSPSKAAGFWQFLKKTATDYGLEVNDEVDERYHLEKATRAACQYLKNAYNELGSWTLAAAAYNAGINAIKQALSSQQQQSYYDLQLNDETARYVYRILAIKLILTNPAQYGFIVDSSELYRPLPYNEIKIDTTINDLCQFALQQGTNFKLLLILNPWLRGNTLKASEKKSYILRIMNKEQRKMFESNELRQP
ncbi:MAG TPA: lytic transglycosylase domain-containing protein [Bacteroidales bacterium]|nr:lytic transglycosylase domain-containing protein [Bacteroidales bacterium]HPO65552.1 lytic transglycosylase domain-containing protein [Bacteroidales bacterium]